MRILKFIKILASGVVAFLMSSCNHDTGNITISYFKQLNMHDDDEELCKNYGCCLEYDSVGFSDGSYAVYRLKDAPQNSLMEFFDNKGRTIATVARASECYAQSLVYDYDDEGRLTHLIRYKSEYFEGLDLAGASYDRTKNEYIGFRQMINDMDYEHPDTAKYEQTNIEYDKDGDAVKCYVVYGSDSIVAPSGYKLSVSVKPCSVFLESDLDGGRYIFHAVMESKDKKLSQYRVCRYADFIPSMESHYQNGCIVQTVWHSTEKGDIHLPAQERGKSRVRECGL